MKIKVDIHFPEDKLEQLEILKQKNLAHLLELKEEASKEEAPNLAWYNWPKKGGHDLVQKLESTKNNLNFYYNLVVVIGVGGSYSGTKAVNDLFGTSLAQPQKENNLKPILFLGYNLSEKDTLEKLKIITNYDPLICVISKSGTTLEPNTAYCLLDHYLKNRYSKEEVDKRTFFATSSTKSPLLNNSKTKKDRIFPIPDNMGGRFSVLSSASLLPLAFAGHKIKELIQGAFDFFDKIDCEDPDTLDSLSYAPARFLAWENNKKIELLAYNEPSLSGFSLWWQQLFAESEGKNSKGLFPSSSLFSRDLHSLGQYIQEGFPSLFETFLVPEKIESSSQIGFEERLRVPTNEKSRKLLGNACGHYLQDLNQKIMTATQKAHSSRKIPYCKITTEKITESNFGFLLAFFQTTCVLSSKLLEVNPFNQPGVEAYKTELRDMLS